MMNTRRVVVTGLGAITPIGLDVDSFWTGLREEKCGVVPITSFDPSRLECRIAAEVTDFDPRAHFEVRTIQRVARFSQMAVVASREAVKSARLPERLDDFHAAIMLGNCIGAIDVQCEAEHKLFTKGPSRIPAMTVPKMIINEAAGNISMDLGIHGPVHTIMTACASGTDAMGHAIDTIRLGRADLVVTGGVETPIIEFTIGSFCAIKALSTSYNDTPELASRPFDKDRDGFVMGEGAGILIFESLEHAQKRGAPILAEVAGWNATGDGYHLTAPNPDAVHVKKAILGALQDGGLTTADIDYVNAHGTSTPTNDPVETKGIKDAFGPEESARIKVSSIKGAIGHTLGAAGALEGIACIKAMQDGFFPPTLHLENPDPACDLDYVPNHGVEGNIRAAISLSLGFGGHNSVIAFKQFAS
jgi:3-oxoacyl-[acyl-carrier-protein] synthase II